MAEHTPGPWELTNNGWDIVGSGFRIALMNDHGDVSGESVAVKMLRIANAHLLAEAPKLLEVLTEIALVARLAPPVTLVAAGKRLAHIEKEARAAIEKAKGG